MSARALLLEHREIKLLQPFHRRATPTIADYAAVDFPHRREASESAGNESLVGAVNVGQTEVLLQ
jgi:hypothetical protein